MLRDVRFALRTLSRQPLVTTVVVLCLAFAVAGNTTVFSIVRSYLLKPMPYQDVDRLAFVWATERATGDGFGRSLSVADFNELRARNRSFDQLEAASVTTRNLTGEGGPPEQLLAPQVTPGLIGMLGYAAVLGRGFVEGDGAPGAPKVVLIAHRFWERRFGSDPSAVGRTLLLDREPHEVIGVLPEDLTFLFITGIDVWLPMTIDPTATDRADRAIGQGIGRLAPGVTSATATEDLERIAADLEARFPETNRGYGALVSRLEEQLPGPTDTRLFSLIQAAGLFVLLIACANIGNLLLARSRARRREVALRAALGAGQPRILRQLLTENVVLALIGGALGLGLGAIGVRVLRSTLAGTLPSFILPRLDAWVLLFSFGVTALAGVLFGLAPSVRALRTDLSGELREGGARGSVGGRRLATTSFVVAQVALALALLCGTGLLLRTFLDLQYGDQGFEPKGLYTFGVALPTDEYADDAARIAFHDRALSELAGLSGVESVASATALPRGRGTPITGVTVVGAERDPAESAPSTSWLAVSPGYVEALRLTLLRGRDLTAADRADRTAVALVDAAFVERFFADGEAIGRRIEIASREREVVGVVSATRQRRIGIIDGPVSMVYLPFSQQPSRSWSMVVRAGAGLDPERLADPARDAIWALDPNLPLASPMTLEQWIDLQLSGLEVLAGILAGFAAFALVLASMGVYSVLAYSVSQRTQEIGVRMAMGARRRDVLGMVLRQGLVLSMVGLALGVPMVWAVERMVVSTLGGLVRQPTLFVVLVGIGLMTTTVVASFLPARRASSVPPTQALNR
ncbi:MAG TPA: ABC transporter permease [Thermoanaerobaculia bacterium]|nr:ABC transporter permease [Thermoanaerobaculia bacterium]